jgi:hypothetical protein
VLTRRRFIATIGIGTLAPVCAQAEQGWRSYTNPRFGTTIAYPDRFRPGRAPTNGAGLTFTGADSASFSVYGSHNALDHDIKGLETFIRENRSPGERITYDARGENWFVLAGTNGDITFYERHLLSHQGKIVNAFVMQYPTRLQKQYDAIVTRMSRSLRAGRGGDTEGNP